MTAKHYESIRDRAAAEPDWEVEVDRDSVLPLAAIHTPQRGELLLVNPVRCAQALVDLDECRQILQAVAMLPQDEPLPAAVYQRIEALNTRKTRS